MILCQCMPTLKMSLDPWNAQGVVPPPARRLPERARPCGHVALWRSFWSGHRLTPSGLAFIRHSPAKKGPPRRREPNPSAQLKTKSPFVLLGTNVGAITETQETHYRFIAARVPRCHGRGAPASLPIDRRTPARLAAPLHAMPSRPPLSPQPSPGTRTCLGAPTANGPVSTSALRRPRRCRRHRHRAQRVSSRGQCPCP